MRLNQFLAQNTSLSRRAADKAIEDGRVEVNGALARLGDIVVDSDNVSLDSHVISNNSGTLTIILNKPVGYVVSRNGQGSKTIYDLLPEEYHHLNPVGRLDKDSSGLLLLTNDGNLANQLTHPRYEKQKKYLVALDKKLLPEHFEQITGKGVKLKDGISKLDLNPIITGAYDYEVTMHEGRNRQIRRTFSALGYDVTKLHRTNFGSYRLETLKSGHFSVTI